MLCTVMIYNIVGSKQFSPVVVNSLIFSSRGSDRCKHHCRWKQKKTVYEFMYVYVQNT